MTEIDKVKSEIDTLQKRLLELEREELLNLKSPAERAFYAEYNYYPLFDIDWVGSTWDIFKRGYDAGVKEEEVQPTKSVNSNSSESLHDILCTVLGDELDDMNFHWSYISNIVDEMLNSVEEWLIKPQDASGSQNGYVESAVEGWNDAIKEIKSRLR